MLTAERLRELLDYDAETGVFRWLVSLTNSVRVGDIAGSMASNGYREIKINGRCYPEHRLAWLYQTNVWPSGDLDHINMGRADNRWCNLREAAKSLNGANAPRRADNVSGFKGVHWDRCKWRARIQVNGKLIHLGYFDTPYRAYANYCLAARKYFGDFARCYEPEMLIIPRKKFEETVLRNLLVATQPEMERAA